MRDDDGFRCRFSSSTSDDIYDDNTEERNGGEMSSFSCALNVMLRDVRACECVCARVFERRRRICGEQRKNLRKLASHILVFIFVSSISSGRKCLTKTFLVLLRVLLTATAIVSPL
jgi:hypothetical protein